MRVFALQPLFTAILAYGLFIAAPPLYAQNKYDVLARTLQPYGSLFHSKSLTKAVQVDLILREGPPLAAQILNQPAQSLNCIFKSVVVAWPIYHRLAAFGQRLQAGKA